MRKFSWGKVVILVLFFIYFPEGAVLAWDDKVTHRDLSEYAAKNSIISERPDSLEKLGFNGGIDNILTWKGKNWTIIKWLQEGAELEDAGSKWDAVTGKARFNNHFHNPLKPWSQAGLDDWVGLHYTGESSLLWAQDGNKQQNIVEGNWSWQKTREYFYFALTSTSITTKQENFAKTFRGLGHQMHLLQDTSVPDHVRNDAHPEDALFGKNILNGNAFFETWAKNERQRIIDLASNPDFPHVSFDISYGDLAPVSQLFDAERYDGLNASAGINQGLSEYTNANFFSNNTIFAVERYSTDNRHYFPFPKKSSTDVQAYINQIKPLLTQIAEDGIQDKGIWIKKTGDGETIDHLVRTSYWTGKIYKTFGEGSLFYGSFYRDENCHEDYASQLIPRAVGYSAGLLDYFFRGNIEITLPLNGIYAVTNNVNAGFTKIKLLAKNTTANGEDMNNGTISLVIKYKPAVETSDFNYKVITEATAIASIPKDQSVELTFDLSQEPLPVSATDVYLQVVYHGRLGMEDGAVAVGFKDISEPTPIDIFNNMDKICINNNSTTGWYDAGSQLTVQQVDKNSDGIAYGTDEWDVYPHDLGLYIKFYNSSVEPSYASPTSYDFYIDNIPNGGHMRALYVLGDAQLNYSYYPVRTKTNPDDYWEHQDFLSVYNGFTVKNQDGDFPVLYTFRNFNMWSGAGFIYINPPYPDNSAQCPMSSL